jgi:hypothetical protein
VRKIAPTLCQVVGLAGRFCTPYGTTATCSRRDKPGQDVRSELRGAWKIACQNLAACESVGQSQCSPVQVALAPVARGRERLACRPRVGRRRRQSPYLNTTASHGDHRPRHDRYVSGTRIDFDRPSGNRPTDRDGGSDRTRLTRTQAYPPMKGPWQVSRLRAGQPRALS